MKKYFLIIIFLCINFNLKAGTSADIILEKGISTSGPYNAGDTITYMLIVINMGPSTATNIMVTDSPVNMTITSVSSTNCTALPCTIPSLTNGASEHITVTMTIDANGPFDNSATAAAAEYDPNPSNNTDNTGNGGNTVIAAVQQVPGLNLFSLILLISFMTAVFYRRKLL